MKDHKSYKFELLKYELESIQKGLDTYNRTVFTVKGLAMTLFTAFIAFVGREAGKPRPIIFMAMAVVLLLFWILDAFFKSIQKVYIRRSLQIEKEIRKPGFYRHLDKDSGEELNFPGIEHAFDDWEKDKVDSAFEEFMNPTVWILYVSLIILDIILGVFL